MRQHLESKTSGLLFGSEDADGKVHPPNSSFRVVQFSWSIV